MIKLNLNNNSLIRIPNNIKLLSKLEEFRLASNRLSALPRSMSELENLKALDLSSNLMEHVPPDMIGWSRLDSLDLSHNMLRSVPMEFAAVTLHVDVKVGVKLACNNPTPTHTCIHLFAHSLAQLPPPVKA